MLKNMMGSTSPNNAQLMRVHAIIAKRKVLQVKKVKIGKAQSNCAPKSKDS